MGNSILTQLTDEITAMKLKGINKKPGKFALEVDNVMMNNKPTNKKELKKAIQGLIISNPTSVINLYTLTGPVTIDLPVLGIDTDKGV